MDQETSHKLAVLIDADNAQPSIIEELLAEIAKYGTANVKRIYGDWTSTKLRGWKEHLLDHSVQPIQQFGYTTGKNATDSAMIIDAMDLLYTGQFDGFCIVSSDSDFTKLAARIREEGLVVYGFGERKTPDPFVAACDKFIYTEVLRTTDVETEKDSPIQRMSTNELKQDTKLVNLMRNAIEASSDESGWAHLGQVGSYIAKQSPEFDPRNYGYRKLGNLVKAIKLFEIEERSTGQGQSKAIYIQDKRK
ncbi:MAG: NYN domain-containing protein [Bacteroidota bacterium]